MVHRNSMRILAIIICKLARVSMVDVARVPALNQTLWAGIFDPEIGDMSSQGSVT